MEDPIFQDKHEFERLDVEKQPCLISRKCPDVAESSGSVFYEQFVFSVKVVNEAVSLL